MKSKARTAFVTMMTFMGVMHSFKMEYQILDTLEWSVTFSTTAYSTVTMNIFDVIVIVVLSRKLLSTFGTLQGLGDLMIRVTNIS